MPQSVLVTGGAGYIGSHVVKELRKKDYNVVVYDNLSTGFATSIFDAELVVGDLNDKLLLNNLVSKHKFDAVLHFAASIIVPESVENPLKYYRNNVCNTLNLLEVCNSNNISNFIFSSSAAVYGIPDDGSVCEEDTVLPINPYGYTKMMSERMIIDLGVATDLNYIILRYFNVAGADPEGKIGQSTKNATHLIKVACQHALKNDASLKIFGADYSTPDGTCIRDYIHITDLAKAHVMALEYISKEKKSDIFNCGYGHGYSVMEIIETVKKISKKELQIENTDRRAGDPPCLIAQSDKIKEILGWQPEFDNIDFIVETAYNWEKQLMS